MKNKFLHTSFTQCRTAGTIAYDRLLNFPLERSTIHENVRPAGRVGSGAANSPIGILPAAASHFSERIAVDTRRPSCTPEKNEGSTFSMKCHARSCRVPRQRATSTCSDSSSIVPDKGRVSHPAQQHVTPAKPRR
ncbi:hypothetical protein Bbelb_335450 [Branchiostoma belcheri]|nr:hypothetical protein Bbelb_335450 [Branchiostoma belcheri]